MSFSLEKLLSLVASLTGKARQIQYAVTKSGKQLASSSFIRELKMSFGFSAVRIKFSAHVFKATICLNKSVDASLLYCSVNYVTLIVKSSCKRLHISTRKKEKNIVQILQSYFQLTKTDIDNMQEGFHSELVSRCFQTIVTCKFVAKPLLCQ